MTALRLCLAGCVAWLSLVSAAVAQGTPFRFRESVSLQADSTVAKKLSTVEDYLAEQEWEQAVGVIRQIAVEHGDSLTRVSLGRYLNVTRYCQTLLAQLPAEGLAVYREQADPQARQWFETGRARKDADLLRKVIRQAFASSYGDDALFLLGEMGWERGELTAARSYWRQLLPLPDRDDENASREMPVLRYPDADFDRAAILARLILCRLAAGAFAEADAEIAAFQQMVPEAEGRLAGRAGNFAKILADIRGEAKTWTFPAPPEDVTTFAFDADRNRVLPHIAPVGGPVWEVPLRHEPSPKDDDRRPISRPTPLPYFPLVFGDKVLVNDAARIAAFDLKTGQPAWPVEGTQGGVIYPVVPDEGSTDEFSRNAASSSRGDDRNVGVPRFTMTVHGGRLYAKMGSPVIGRARQEVRERPSDLVCLNLRQGQGKLEWKVSADELDSETTGWAFEGSPVADDDRVYVSLRRSRPQTQLNVACLDAADGRLLWNRRVCAAVRHLSDRHNLVGHRLLTLADETVFYSTDAGAIAALDAFDGRVRWVRTYESRPLEEHAALNDPRKNGLVPCLYHQGLLIAAPNDSPAVMAIDAASGVLVWRRELDDRVRHLLGVGHGVLVAAGDSLWGLDVETGRRLWGRPQNDPEFAGYGRGLLVEDEIWWPTREHVEIIDQRTGRRVRRQPIDLGRRGVSGGNLVLGDGVLLVAGPHRLTALGSNSVEIEPSERDLAGLSRDPERIR